MKKTIKAFLKYLHYFKLLFLRFVFASFGVFPIKNNRIMFISFNGKQYSCNPRAVSESIMEEERYEIFWAFLDPKTLSKVVPDGIKCIKYKSLKFYYYVKTSKVVVMNGRSDGTFSRRKAQRFIQTWHASNGYKVIATDKGVAAKISWLACKDFSYVNVGCRNMLTERVHGTMHFFGDIIHGTPRMDRIIQGETDVRERVLEGLGIPQDSYVVLYAPTYRNSTACDYGLDYQSVIDSFSKRLGAKVFLLVRMHYYVTPKIKDAPAVIDVSKFPDIQDLLLTCDALISDYSSCIWDYSFLYKPCFLFCNDLETYNNFSVPIESWGFDIARTNEELSRNIVNFSKEQFVERMEAHHLAMGSFEDGKATKRTAELISRICFGDNNE